MATSKFRVLPYKQGSASAKALALALGGKVLKLVRDEPFKPKRGDTVVNWGNTNDNGVLMGMCRILNPVASIRAASNKKLFFEKMKENGHEDLIPPFWTSKGDIPGDAYPIVCRTVLAGHSGAGIVLAVDPEHLVDCSLYVKYVKKEEEYRVHCGRKGDEISVIAVQRKARRHDFENPNWQIRNHANGFIYARDNINPPEAVINSARKALECSGLDFGAVDVIWNKKKEKAFVLEINTAPGLEGQTVQDYANFFSSVA